MPRKPLPREAPTAANATVNQPAKGRSPIKGEMGAYSKVGEITRTNTRQSATGYAKGKPNWKSKVESKVEAKGRSKKLIQKLKSKLEAKPIGKLKPERKAKVKSQSRRL